MLEEVQMPPRFILRVVNRATLASALGAGEPAPARKVHIQIEPTILDRKLATRHRPRRLQPKGQLEKIGVSHPLTINSIPTDHSPSEPKKRPYPLHSARSQKVLLAFRSYQLPVIALGKATSKEGKEAVCLVFEKVNTGGVSLSVFELVTASFAADNFNLCAMIGTAAKSAKSRGG